MKIYDPAFLFLALFSFAFDTEPEILHSIPHPGSPQKQKTNEPVATNILFKSTDGGQTWQDISKGLPLVLQEEGFPGNGFIANDSALYVQSGNELYQGNPNHTMPAWKKEIFPDDRGNIAAGKNGLFTYNWEGQTLQKIYGSNVWSPLNTNFQVKEMRSVFETEEGTLFIACEKGLYKTTDNGKTLKQVVSDGWVIKLVKSNGVLMATSQNGIIRSTDDGEHWTCVLNEGGVGIDVAPIKGGFAAVVANTHLMARTVRASFDEGKTWQPVDAGLPADLRISSIVEFGEYFFCGHPAGIFRSSDKGKTWKLLFPSVNDKVFNLVISGNVIYAILKGGGC
ncbi:hypothetical protein ACX0G7_27075 [Flavitalea antarctica]